jgi:PAS domain S-box-containing protein
MGSATGSADHVGVPSSEEMTSAVRNVLTHHVIENDPDLLVVLNGEDRIVLVNRAAESLGWSSRDVIGLEFSALVHPDDWRALQSVSRDAHVGDGRIAGVELPVRVRDLDGGTGWRRLLLRSYTCETRDATRLSVYMLQVPQARD